MAANAYADARGVIGFCLDGEVPRGVLVFARHRSVDELKELVAPKARLAHDGRTLLVPGVPEARNQDQGRQALEMWRDWSFPNYRALHGAMLITDDVIDISAKVAAEGWEARL